MYNSETYITIYSRHRLALTILKMILIIVLGHFFYIVIHIENSIGTT